MKPTSSESTPPFELLTSPDTGAVSILRFHHHELFQSFCKSYLKQQPQPKKELLYTQLNEEPAEDLLVIQSKYPEIHFHAGKANIQHIKNLITQLPPSPKIKDPQLHQLRLWESCFSSTKSRKGMEYLLKVHPDQSYSFKPPYRIEGYDFLKPYRISLVGPANAGKSTLFNALLGRSHALVSPHPGTTRDLIMVRIDLLGYEIELIDTAGFLDESSTLQENHIHQQAQQHSLNIVQNSDLILNCSNINLLDHPNIINLHLKSDLTKNNEGLSLSALTGEGMEQLYQLLEQNLKACKAGPISPCFHPQAETNPA